MRRNNVVSSLGKLVVGVLLVAGGVFLSALWRPLVEAQEAGGQQPFETPPEGQTYLGSKQCAACHFNQFTAWKATKHSKSFDILPAKYKKDASCLKCHATGQGEETGYKDDSTAALAGTSCEACHGAGSKHGEIAKTFGNKKLSPEEDKYVRSSIHKFLPGNACIQCHESKAHKKHPPYDK
jgi:hypothetical protein